MGLLFVATMPDKDDTLAKHHLDEAHHHLLRAAKLMEPRGGREVQKMAEKVYDYWTGYGGDPVDKLNRLDFTGTAPDGRWTP